MHARTARAAATLVIGVFATVGALSTPAGVLAGLTVLGLIVGTIVAASAPHLPRPAQRRSRTTQLQAGALAAAIFLGLAFTVFGLLATLGGVVTASVLAVLALVAMVTGVRRGTYRSEPGPADVVASVTLPPPTRPVEDLSTDELCTAWRRSYFQLLVSRDPPARWRLVQRRQDYLDEIERRDRGGFLRWLDSGARAGSDPAPYLTTRRCSRSLCSIGGHIDSLVHHSDRGVPRIRLSDTTLVAVRHLRARRVLRVIARVTVRRSRPACSPDRSPCSARQIRPG